MSAEESDLVENPPSPQDSPKAETLKEETPEIEDPSHAAALDSPAKMNQAGTSVSDKDSVTSSTTDVPFMDWAEFESNYTKALIDANEVEDRLVEDFQKLSKAFMLWADASANHDNMRVAKRLKTRERYVQLSEQKLEEKKKHYVEVVQAFQNALKLLSS